MAAFAAAGCASLEVDDADAEVSGPVERFDASRKPPSRDVGDPGDPPPPSDAGPGGDPCGGLEATGECDGETVRWCDHERPQSLDCAGFGLRCGFDGTLMRTTCVPPGSAADAGPSGCPLPPEGQCDDNGVLYVCQGDRVHIENCPAMSRTCGWDVGSDRNACLDGPPPEDACGGVTGAGRCVDGQVEACRGNQVRREDCPAQGSDCEIIGGRAVCVAPLPPDPCEGIPNGGECVGDTAVYCVDAQRVELDCSAVGWICFNIPQVLTLCSDPNAGSNPGPEPEPDPPPLEGEGTPCEVDGAAGVCQRVGDCGGTATAGHCPGPAEVQCCT
jgi:hypothetical protein